MPKLEGRLFPPGLDAARWSTFAAAGYSNPVPGICYRTMPPGYFGLYIERPFPVTGMPLGGIDTGALYLEPSGVLGYTSIFNHLTPVGGPLNTPYLGIVMNGRAWVFGTGQTKNYTGNNRPSYGINVLGSMQESEYWGHYPIADVEYKSDAPLQIGVRSWSPFIPGDTRSETRPERFLKFTCGIRVRQSKEGAWFSAFRALPNITRATTPLVGRTCPQSR